MSHAKDTLALMEDFKASLARPSTQTMVKGFFVSHMGRIPGASIEAEHLTQKMTQAMETAEAYFLHRDMLPVVLWAARSLDENDAFEADLWPTPRGFVVLDEPLLVKDARGRTMTTKALLWTPLTISVQGEAGTTGGTMVVHLTDVEDERDDLTTLLLTEPGPDGQPAFTRNELLALGRLQVNHADFIPNGRRVGPQMVSTADMEPDYYGLPAVPEAENPQRFILSFLLMLNQTITATTREQVAPKQAARMTKRRLPSMVTVVHMRRIAGANRHEGESHVEWAHRWIVRGHWRNQPCKVDGDWTHRRIWIAPFVKGPDDAPFKVSQKVYALDR